MATYDKSNYRAKAEENVNEWKVPELQGDAIAFDQFSDPALKENSDVASARRAYGQWMNIHKLRETAQKRPPEATADGHFLSCHRQADSWIRRASESHNRALEDLQLKRNGIEAEKRDSLSLHETPRATEVRTMLRSMGKRSDRTALLMKAVESADPEIVSGVLYASPALSGLERSDIESIEQAYTSKHAPQIAERRKAIAQAEKVLDAAYADCSANYQRMFPADRLARIQKEQAEANEARSALNPE